MRRVCSLRIGPKKNSCAAKLALAPERWMTVGEFLGDSLVKTPGR